MKELKQKPSNSKKKEKDTIAGERTTKAILQNDKERQGLTIQILTLLNELNYKGKLIFDILSLIKEYTGFEAVGIRIRHGEDYPYYVAKGFPVKFIEAENYLCMRDKNGKYILDSQGRSILECMCGNVISGRTDPSKDFFTEGGSFWTNSTSGLLASTTEEDRQSPTRNRCYREGYESMALIPLHSDKKVIGLLQLNDKRIGMLSQNVVEFFEGIGASIGIGIAHMEADNKLKKSEKEYRKLARQLAEANDMKKLLLDVITHDLRNSAGTIYNFAGMLKEQQPDYKFADIIQLSSKSLLDVINNTTSLARIDLGEDIDKNKTDICKVIKDTLQEFHLPDSMMDFEFLSNPEESLYVNANPIISEVFKNYISNALKYAFDSKKLVVEALKDDNNIIIKVKDFGKTIPKGKRKVIFKRFIKLNKDNLQSSGLGLAIVKRIAAAHDGDVWVEPNNPEGNSFCLRLPAV